MRIFYQRGQLIQFQFLQLLILLITYSKQLKMLSWLKDKIIGVKGPQDCVFCKILENPENLKLNACGKLLYEDQQLFVIHDLKKASARQHILIITKQHIRTAYQIKDKQILYKMQKVGEQVLQQLDEQSKIQQKIEKNEKKMSQKPKIEPKYRFGFHLPPYNSVDHVHLHGFLLPIQTWMLNTIVYGTKLTSIQSIV